MPSESWSQMRFDEPQIMAVLNITPDSFSDGGTLIGNPRAAIDQAAKFLDSGATILDVGGESTRPGASLVSEDEEFDRVIPVIDAIRSRFDCFLSVDTSTPNIMREAALRGVNIINDVRALNRPGAIEVAAKTGLPVCLMHMLGSPRDMQVNPSYEDTVSDVLAWLLKRVDICMDKGIDPSRIAIDPGFGFGKTLKHNIELFHGLHRFVRTGYPVIVGFSRKSMIGEITGRPVDQRATGSAVAAAIAASHGVKIVRVHDVQQTKDAISVMKALLHGMQ